MYVPVEVSLLFVFDAAGDKFLVFVTGAGHITVSQSCCVSSWWGVFFVGGRGVVGGGNGSCLVYFLSL
jgi:hypothetical protein